MIDQEHNQADECILALAGKGRIQEETLIFFERIGLEPQRSRSGRAYAGALTGLDAALRFFPARDIAIGLGNGTIHIGVTGEDLLAELCPETAVAAAMKLGFSRADLILAVPEYWIDVDDIIDFEEVAASFRGRYGRRLRIATKYPHLTQLFLTKYGVTDYRIVESLGATEGAPAAGTADAVVDITSSGETLAANGLKILRDGLIMRSQAVLAVSVAANWSRGALRILRRVLDLAAAEQRAREVRELKFYNAPENGALIVHLERDYGCVLASTAARSEMTILHCPFTHLHDVLEFLRNAGKNVITVTHADLIFERCNPLYDHVRQIADLESI